MDMNLTLTAEDIETLEGFCNSSRVGAYMRNDSETDEDFDLWQAHCDEAERNLILFAEKLLMKGRAEGYRQAQKRFATMITETEE